MVTWIRKSVWHLCLAMGLFSGCSARDGFSSLLDIPVPVVPFVMAANIAPMLRSTTALEWIVSESAIGSTTFSMKTQYQNVQRPFTVSSDVTLVATNRYDLFLGATFRQSYPVFDISKLDILVVVDSSDSIDIEQAKLAKSFQDILSEVQDKDWRIIVTSHDAQSCNSQIITKGMPNAETAFSRAVRMGQNASNSETPFFKSLRMLRAFGLDRPERKTTFTPAATHCNELRKNVPVGLLILTNEDECSNGFGCPMIKDNFVPVHAFYTQNYIGLAQTPYGGHYRAAGIYWPPGATSKCASGLRKADSLNYSLTSANHSTVPAWGQRFDICVDDFHGYMKTFSTSLKGIKNLYPLHFNENLMTANEVPGSHRVFINDLLIPATDYRFVKVSALSYLELLNPAHTSGDLRVEYLLTGIAPVQELVADKTKLALGYEHYALELRSRQHEATTSIEFNPFRIGNRYLTQGTDYYIADRGTDQVIVVTVPLLPGDIVLSRYRITKARDPKESQSTSLAMGQNLVVDTNFPITFWNGSRQLPMPGLDISESDGIYTASYDELPNGTYSVKYTTLNDPVLAYPLSVPYRSQITRVTEVLSQKPLPFTFLIDLSKLLFRSDFIRNGKGIAADYSYWELTKGELLLSKEPLLDSIAVTNEIITDPACSRKGAGLVKYVAGKLTINCPNPAGVQRLGIKYDSLELIPLHEIQIPEIALAGKNRKWTVFLNDVELSNENGRIFIDLDGRVSLSGQFRESDVITIKFSAQVSAGQP